MRMKEERERERVFVFAYNSMFFSNKGCMCMSSLSVRVCVAREWKPFSSDPFVLVREASHVKPSLSFIY